MSQELFQKALAAKLAGDENGFNKAVREAIVAKTKALLGEAIQTSDANGADFYFDEVEISDEQAQQLGLASGAGIYGVGGRIEITHFDGGSAGSRDEPGYGAEVDLEFTQAFIMDAEGTETQIQGSVAQSLLTDEQLSKLETDLIQQSQANQSTARAERSYVRRHGSLPDSY